MSILLSIPLEIRLIVYEIFLGEIKDKIISNTQPSNDHLILLDTCRQVEHEAGDLAGFRAYLSLRHEHEISAFLETADPHVVARITHLDVANDGRVIQHPRDDECTPVSQLHRVLEKLPSLQALRVFDCNRTPSLHGMESNSRLVWSFETAMFPSGKRTGLTSYEFYIAPTTKLVALHSASGTNIRRLRLSGLVRLDEPLESCKGLRHLTIYGVTGNYFDSRPLPPMEKVALHTFQYGQGDRLGFEMKAAFLMSLLSGSHATLTKLVLLHCNKISTIGLADCLRSLRSLEYFALSLITATELEANFIEVLPPRTCTIKLKINHARWTFPFYAEEQNLCESLGRWMVRRSLKMKTLRLHLPNIFGSEEVFPQFTIEEEVDWRLMGVKHGVDVRFEDWELGEAT